MADIAAGEKPAAPRNADGAITAPSGVVQAEMMSGSFDPMPGVSASAA